MKKAHCSYCSKVIGDAGRRQLRRDFCETCAAARERFARYQAIIDQLIVDSRRERPGARSLMIRDANDHAYVLAAYRVGRKREAMRHASSMDTAAREMIPPDIWVDLGGELIEKEGR